jgi:hypothetical protein
LYTSPRDFAHPLRRRAHAEIALLINFVEALGVDIAD